MEICKSLVFLLHNISSLRKYDRSPIVEAFFEFFSGDTLSVTHAAMSVSSRNGRRGVTFLSHVPYITGRRIFTRKIIVGYFIEPKKASQRLTRYFNVVFGMVFAFLVKAQRNPFCLAAVASHMNHTTLIKLKKVIIT